MRLTTYAPSGDLEDGGAKQLPNIADPLDRDTSTVANVIFFAKVDAVKGNPWSQEQLQKWLADAFSNESSIYSPLTRTAALKLLTDPSGNVTTDLCTQLERLIAHEKPADGTLRRTHTYKT